MTAIPCPNCGEPIACSESAVGRKLACPKCHVLLRLDADSDGRPRCGVARRPLFGLVRLAVVLGVFLVGLGTGFVWGHRASHVPPAGVSATSVGFFSASNSIVVTDPPPPPPAAKPAPPMPPAPR